MILCRFAGQTAVQLPPERRLIGMNFCSCCVNHLSDGFTLIHKGRNGTFMNGALSRCLQITLEKYKCHHISPLAVLFYAIETLFLFQNHQYERESLYFTDFCCFIFFSPHHSLKSMRSLWSSLKSCHWQFILHWKHWLFVVVIFSLPLFNVSPLSCL